MLDLHRRTPSLLDSISLRVAAQVGEPDSSLVAIAALGVSAAGPSDWPSHRRGQTWPDYGRDLLAYLRLHGVRDDDARLWGVAAFAALPEAGITEEETAKASDFFGGSLGRSPVADSPTATSGTPSEG
jgi:hypothetical protein